MHNKGEYVPVSLDDFLFNLIYPFKALGELLISTHEAPGDPFNDLGTILRDLHQKSLYQAEQFADAVETMVDGEVEVLVPTSGLEIIGGVRRKQK